MLAMWFHGAQPLSSSQAPFLISNLAGLRQKASNVPAAFQRFLVASEIGNVALGYCLAQLVTPSPSPSVSCIAPGSLVSV
jgi:hypothetical protein